MHTNSIPALRILSSAVVGGRPGHSCQPLSSAVIRGQHGASMAAAWPPSRRPSAIDLSHFPRIARLQAWPGTAFDCRNCRAFGGCSPPCGMEGGFSRASATGATPRCARSKPVGLPAFSIDRICLRHRLATAHRRAHSSHRTPNSPKAGPIGSAARMASAGPRPGTAGDVAATVRPVRPACRCALPQT